MAVQGPAPPTALALLLLQSTAWGDAVVQLPITALPLTIGRATKAQQACVTADLGDWKATILPDAPNKLLLSSAHHSAVSRKHLTIQLSKGAYTLTLHHADAVMDSTPLTAPATVPLPPAASFTFDSIVATFCPAKPSRKRPRPAAVQ